MRALGAIVVLAAALAVVGVSEGSHPRPMCKGEAATIVGTTGPDRILGTNGADVIVGRKGNDRIRARAGDDLVCGYRGNDLIWGGPGEDRLRSGDGSNKLYGGGGIDRLAGGKDLGNLCVGGPPGVTRGAAATSRTTDATGSAGRPRPCLHSRGSIGGDQRIPTRARCARARRRRSSAPLDPTGSWEPTDRM